MSRAVGSQDAAAVAVGDVSRQFRLAPAATGRKTSDPAVEARRLPPTRVGEIEAEAAAQQKDERQRHAARAHLCFPARLG
jgi:hypothetical protein